MLNISVFRIDTDIADVYTRGVIEYKKRNPSSGIVLIVPDSMSHIAERNLAAAFGGCIENEVEVLTFHQMIRRFLPPILNRITDIGKRMLLFRAAERADISDGIYASAVKKTGFLDLVSELVSEFKRYAVQPQEILNISDKCESDVLRDKLTTVAKIYKEYNGLFLQEQFTDSDDDLFRVAEVIEENGYFSDKAVWIAGFEELIPSNLRVIEAILKTSSTVSALFVSSDIDGSELFAVTEGSINKLLDLCKKYNLSFNFNRVECRKEKSKELEHLAKSFETNKAFTEQCEHIGIYKSSDIYTEIDEMAIKLSDMVLEDGYRYGDIGVAVSDAEAYLPFVEAVFSGYNIPFYSDVAVSVAEHPASMLITAVGDMVRDGMSVTSVMSFLRTGLVSFGGALSAEDIDRIENHAISMNMRGSMWTDEKYWNMHRGDIFDNIVKKERKNSEILLEWEKAKELFLQLYSYCKKVSKKTDVRTLSTDLFVMFSNIGLYSEIERVSSKLLQKDPNESLRFERIWNILTELFEQAVTVVGDEEMSFDELLKYVKSGLFEAKMDIIPAGIDRVCIGDTLSFSASNVKVLFVLGATSGRFPVDGGGDSLLSEIDREVLSDNNISLAPFGLGKNAYNEFRMYKLLTLPTDYLYISYPLADIAGNKLIPSIVITTLSIMYPKLTVNKREKDYILVSTPEVTIKELLRNVDKENPLFQKLCNWFKLRSEKWTEELSLIDAVDAHNEYAASITPEKAALLYKNYKSYSVSRLEKFYVCPFRYFLENGLKAREREERKVKKSNIGTLLHWAVQEYCMRVDAGEDAAGKHKNWVNLTDADSKKLIGDIITEARNSLGDIDKRSNNMLGKIQAVLERCVPIINLSFKNSSYTSVGYEWNFENLVIEENGHSVSVHGIIDRLDILEKDGEAHMRVIDYKSGVKGFSAAGIYNKLDLQLGVYSIAACDAYRKGLLGCGGCEPNITGMFYDKLVDEYEKGDISFSPDKNVPSSQKLDGMIFADSELNGTKRIFRVEDFSDIDSTLSSTGVGSYAKLSLNKDGTTLNRNSSSVADVSDADVVSNWVKKAVVDADINIKNGVIDVFPYKKSDLNTGCTNYCPYKDICAYDLQKNEKYRTLKTGKLSFDIMKDVE